MIIHKKRASGSRILDYLLCGGYEPGIITTIYGPAGSGKTNLAMLCAIKCARDKKKVVYVDTESSFSVERLKQIAIDYTKFLERLIFLRPTNFDEQVSAFKKLRDIVKTDSDNIGVIIIDTISMLYRLELGKSEKVYDINRELGKQMAWLSEIASKKNIPIIITNQVYSDFGEKDKVKMVGGDILKYWSKCLIELQITEQGNRKAILRKHRSQPEGKEIVFKIVQTGIIGTKEKKRFGFFLRDE